MDLITINAAMWRVMAMFLNVGNINEISTKKMVSDLSDHWIVGMYSGNNSIRITECCCDAASQ